LPQVAVHRTITVHDPQEGQTMKNLKILTVVLTALISIMSVPFAFMPESDLEGWFGGAAWAAWGATILGVLGMVAAVGLIRNADWALPAVFGVAVLQVAGSITATSSNMDGAAFGLAISAALLVSAAAYFALTRRVVESRI
jgi:hypothetical protein